MNKIEIIRKFWLKSRFSNNFNQIYDFLSKSKIFDYFQQNQEFSKTLTKTEIFGNFDHMRGLRFFLTKSRFSKILSEIKIFQKFQHKASFFF